MSDLTLQERRHQMVIHTLRMGAKSQRLIAELLPEVGGGDDVRDLGGRLDKVWETADLFRQGVIGIAFLDELIEELRGE